jgi:hypothetical protein
MSESNLTIELPVREYRWLKNQAEQHGMTIEELAIEIIREQLESFKSTDGPVCPPEGRS